MGQVYNTSIYIICVLQKITCGTFSKGYFLESFENSKNIFIFKYIADSSRQREKRLQYSMRMSYD